MNGVSIYSPRLRPADLRETSPLESCQRCGRLCVCVAQTFTIRCAEGRRVKVFVCYRCEAAGLGISEKARAA